MNVDEIFEAAKKDPTLFSTLDIEAILDSVENEKNDYLENKTMDDITKEVFENICELALSKETIKDLCDKLIGYRFVDEIHELFRGRHVRWIRRDTDKLTTGGIVVDIKFLKDGIQVLTKNNMNRFIQYRFDECLSFQKLSNEEQLLLMAYEELNK
jgi:predicted peroxiredoxin